MKAIVSPLTFDPAALTAHLQKLRDGKTCRPQIKRPRPPWPRPNLKEPSQCESEPWSAQTRGGVNCMSIVRHHRLREQSRPTKFRCLKCLVAFIPERGLTTHCRRCSRMKAVRS